MERRREVLAGVALASLMLALFSQRYFVGDFTLGEIHVGLRAASGCALGECKDIDHTGSADRLFVGAGQVAFYLGWMLVLALVMAVALPRWQERSGALPDALQRFLDVDGPWRSAAALGCGFLAALIVFFFAFDDRGFGIGMGSSFIFAAAGGMVPAVLGLARNSAGPSVYINPKLKLRAPSPTPAAARPAAAAGASMCEERPERTPAGAISRPAARQAAEYNREIEARAANSMPREPRRRQRRLARGMSGAANSAVDTAKTSLRFVARSVEIGEEALEVVLERHSQSYRLPILDVAEIVARQLPPDPPFEKLVFLDLVAADADKTPVRLLPSTRVNYSVLPGGMAPNSRENFRKLAAFLSKRNPMLVFEDESRAFLESNRAPPAFLSIKQFAAYDERF